MRDGVKCGPCGGIFGASTLPRRSEALRGSKHVVGLSPPPFPQLHPRQHLRPRLAVRLASRASAGADATPVAAFPVSHRIPRTPRRRRRHHRRAPLRASPLRPQEWTSGLPPPSITTPPCCRLRGASPCSYQRWPSPLSCRQ